MKQINVSASSGSFRAFLRLMAEKREKQRGKKGFPSLFPNFPLTLAGWLRSGSPLGRERSLRLPLFKSGGAEEEETSSNNRR